MKKIFTFLLAGCAAFMISACFVTPQVTDADQLNRDSGQETSTHDSSVGGKYYNLIKKLRCPQDQGQYGDFHDYGYWSGTEWCGQPATSGYWVWVAPDWYIWRNMR